jgi:hypothetical protein
MRRRALVVPTLLAILGTSALAQTPPSERRAVGLVRDSLGTPIADAEVSAGRARARTDSLGRFSVRIAGGDSTTITVKRLGYESVTFTVFTDSLVSNDLDVELQPVARTLPAIAVTKERHVRVPTIEGFEQRRVAKAGFGAFFTRAELADREGQRLSNILRATRGVSIIRGPNGQNLLRFARWSSRGAGCPPDMWLDGAMMKGLEIDEISTNDVEAVELYANSSSAPVEFAAFSQVGAGGRTGCGVVAIWTRRPALKSR